MNSLFGIYLNFNKRNKQNNDNQINKERYIKQ